jgi:hypothetical protein
MVMQCPGIRSNAARCHYSKLRPLCTEAWGSGWHDTAPSLLKGPESLSVTDMAKNPEEIPIPLAAE